jgi:hypothetical protein
MKAEKRHTDHPLLCNTKLVEAIASGRKTVTRRVMKPQPKWPSEVKYWDYDAGHNAWIPISAAKRKGDAWPSGRPADVRNEYGRPGDTLWVRERTCRWIADDSPPWPERWTIGPDGARLMFYQGNEALSEELKQQGRAESLPGIFMPKWMCRMRLQVVALECERLHAITTQAIAAEGVQGDMTDPSMGSMHDAEMHRKFRKLWDELNGKRGYGWTTNPWVFVVAFQLERIERL